MGPFISQCGLEVTYRRAGNRSALGVFLPHVGKPLHDPLRLVQNPGLNICRLGCLAKLDQSTLGDAQIVSSKPEILSLLTQDITN